MTRPPERERVLVIKLGALGDFLLSVGPMQAIRRHHPEAHLTLLTRAAYHDLAASSGLFDAIEIDPEPRGPSLGWLERRSWFRQHAFTRVYDLQTSSRTAWYFRLTWPAPPDWSGKVAGCSLRHVYPADHGMHTIERQRAQLALAGIDAVPLADLCFLDGDLSGFDLPARIAILIPGASPDRPLKRWPAERFGELARTLKRDGLTPVLIGREDATDAARSIRAAEPAARDLTMRTDLGQLAALARRAALAVGNDTGPTHLVSLAGCPTLALFGPDSDPAKTGPAGPGAASLRAEPLSDLTAGQVVAALPVRA